jgi:hypothetical protein
LLALLGAARGVTAGALWDPYEVSVAEVSRRLAVQLLGGAELAVPGADNSVPIRADLGRGELPFTSIALGYRLFGLSAWAGRLPLLLWALLGVGSLVAATSKLWDRRTGLYAGLILLTTPLYWLPTRVLFGDAVTLATFSIAWSGLTAACFAPLSLRGRLAFALWGCLGLYAGFWCRGPLLSVAAPALAAALPALLERPRELAARRLALAFAVVGFTALGLGIAALSLADKTGEYSVFVGTALATARKSATFELPLGDFTHAAYPFSALAPLALVVATQPLAAGSQRGGVCAASLGLALGLAFVGWLTPWLGPLLVPSVACFTVLLAAGMRELEAGRVGSRLLGVLVAALAVVIGLDLNEHPEKLLVAFGLGDLELPEGSVGAASVVALAGAGGLALFSLSCLGEDEPTPGEERGVFDRGEYVRALRALERAWNGNLVFALLLLETSLVGFLVLSALSERVVSLPQLDRFGSFSRQAAALGAIVVPLAPVALLGALAVRDLARLAFRARGTSLTRARGVLLAAAALALYESFGFYPALARELSPSQAFDRYRELSRPGESLALLGQHESAARYQGAPAARGFEQPDAAFDWLVGAEDSGRRWLVLRSKDLPDVSSRFRALHGRNLPVLDSRSSELLLASSELRPGERNDTPLSRIVLDEPPHPQKPVSALLGEELELLGFSLRDPQGRLTETLTPNVPARLTLYFRVRAPLKGRWQVFVHVDGLQRRFNADHEPLHGQYPARWWRAGDVLADTTEIRLEPHFSPGDYRLYFGLFSGERRLPVRQGREEDDRVVAGTLQVR